MSLFSLLSTWAQKTLIPQKPERYTTSKWEYVQFALFGILFTAGGLYALYGFLPPSSWQETSGTITENHKTTSHHQGKTGVQYAPTISYQVGGKTFTLVSPVSSSFQYDIGDTVSIRYNPDQPAESILDFSSIGPHLFLILFPLIGLTALFGSIASWHKTRRRTQEIEMLKTQGHKVQGIVTNIEEKYGKHKSRRLFLLEVTLTDLSGTSQVIKSDLLRSIGILSIRPPHTSPTPIDVYLDPTNPERAYVDIDSLPNITQADIDTALKTLTNTTK